jgi:hypothetical protein
VKCSSFLSLLFLSSEDIVLFFRSIKKKDSMNHEEIIASLMRKYASPSHVFKRTSGQNIGLMRPHMFLQGYAFVNGQDICSCGLDATGVNCTDQTHAIRYLTRQEVSCLKRNDYGMYHGRLVTFDSYPIFLNFTSLLKKILVPLAVISTAAASGLPSSEHSLAPNAHFASTAPSGTSLENLRNRISLARNEVPDTSWWEPVALKWTHGVKSTVAEYSAKTMITALAETRKSLLQDIKSHRHQLDTAKTDLEFGEAYGSAREFQEMKLKELESKWTAFEKDKTATPRVLVLDIINDNLVITAELESFSNFMLQITLEKARRLVNMVRGTNRDEQLRELMTSFETSVNASKEAAKESDQLRQHLSTQLQNEKNMIEEQKTLLNKMEKNKNKLLALTKQHHRNILTQVQTDLDNALMSLKSNTAQIEVMQAKLATSQAALAQNEIKAAELMQTAEKIRALVYALLASLGGVSVVVAGAMAVKYLRPSKKDAHHQQTNTKQATLGQSSKAKTTPGGVNGGSEAETESVRSGRSSSSSSSSIEAETSPSSRGNDSSEAETESVRSGISNSSSSIEAETSPSSRGNDSSEAETASVRSGKSSSRGRSSSSSRGRSSSSSRGSDSGIKKRKVDAEPASTRVPNTEPSDGSGSGENHTGKGTSSLPDKGKGKGAPGKGKGKAKSSWKPDPGVYTLLKKNYINANLDQYNLDEARLKKCIEMLILPLINVLYMRSCTFPLDNEPYAHLLETLFRKVGVASITPEIVDDSIMTGEVEVMKPTAELNAETLKHDLLRKKDRTYKIPEIQLTKRVPFLEYAADLKIIFFPQNSQLRFAFPAQYDVNRQVDAFMLQTANQTVGQGIVKVLTSCMKGDGRDVSSDSIFPTRSLSSVLDDVRFLTGSVMTKLSSLKDPRGPSSPSVLNTIIRPAMQRSFMYTSIDPPLQNTKCPLTSSIRAGHYTTKEGTLVERKGRNFRTIDLPAQAVQEITTRLLSDVSVIQVKQKTEIDADAAEANMKALRNKVDPNLPYYCLLFGKKIKECKRVTDDIGVGIPRPYAGSTRQEFTPLQCFYFEAIKLQECLDNLESEKFCKNGGPVVCRNMQDIIGIVETASTGFQIPPTTTATPDKIRFIMSKWKEILGDVIVKLCKNKATEVSVYRALQIQIKKPEDETKDSEIIDPMFEKQPKKFVTFDFNAAVHRLDVGAKEQFKSMSTLLEKGVSEASRYNAIFSEIIKKTSKPEELVTVELVTEDQVEMARSYLDICNAIHVMENLLEEFGSVCHKPKPNPKLVRAHSVKTPLTSAHVSLTERSRSVHR